MQEDAGRAIRRAIAHHHLEGRSVPYWRDGRIVELHSDGSLRPMPDPTAHDEKKKSA